ncbi:TRF2-interacting telomeric protein/Rap1 C terminal domain-containing protein [Lasiosphaeris hirsuta]|uniref:DNA-binding protein RAP1 n=1 Tax=Lasiosphaeris hirsuta TaxID=260670 RepID=A0AA40A195_9PEZI|nr:TRF2-interacting telomeric protein/Rap1 C terminal domain-containing protein [Lasiosphaeris hirsuta]
MSASIVYEGINGGYEGMLWKGTKFWVHMRVPMRSKWVDAIKNNGGKIVQLEKLADVCIADHVRKDAPPGSTSWKYVEDCLREGELVDIDGYRIEHAVAPRPAGSAQPTKGTKTPFTQQDDRLLIRWVLEQERKGEATGGQKIYVALAERYPNHTYHSWRDRWVKKYALVPREELPDFGRPRSPSPSPSARKPPVVSPAPVRVKPAPIPQTPKSKSRFTPEDDKLLRDWVNKRVSEGGKANGNLIYQHLAAEHPHHSFHSWRDRWIRHISKQAPPAEDNDLSPVPQSVKPPVTRPARYYEPSPVRQSAKQPIAAPAARTQPRHQPQPQPRTQPQPRLHPGHSLDSRSPRVSGNMTPLRDTVRRADLRKPDSPYISMPSRSLSLAQGPRGSPTIQPAGHTPNASQSTNPTGRQRQLKEKNDRIRSARTIQRAWQRYKARQELKKLRNAQATLVNNIEQRTADLLGKHSVSLHEQRAVSSSPVQEKLRTDKEQFYIDFRGFHEARGTNPVPWVQVGGKTLGIWDFWHAVTSTEQEDPDNRLWEDIAASLGFNWLNQPGVPARLKAAYDTYLRDFEILLRSFEAELYGDGAEETEMEEPAEEIPAEVVTFTAEQFRSSPPVHGLKRSFALAMSSSLGGFSPPKRRRYSQDEEIPCTPDKEAALAPKTNGKPAVLPTTEPTPTRYKNSQSSPLMLPPLPPVRNRVVEPETQDFNFGQVYDSIDEEEEEEAEGATPSQQLRSESEAGSLTPAPPPPMLPRPRIDVESQSQQAPIDVPDESDTDTPSEFFPSPRKLTLPRPTVQSSATRNASRRTLPADWTRPSSPETDSEEDENSSPAFESLEPPTQPSSSRRFLEDPPRRFSGTASLARRSPSPPSSTPQPARTPRPPVTEVSIIATIERFIALGYPHPIVMQSLMATTLEPGAAGVVMESLNSGRGVPQNEPGVWTAADDDALGLVDQVAQRGVMGENRPMVAKAGRERRRLVDKHGLVRIEARRRYLRDLARV